MKWRSNVLDHQLSQRVLLKGACFFIQIVSSVWWNTIISISSALPSIIRVVQTLGWKWPKGKPNLKGMASCNQTKEKTELDSLRQLLPCTQMPFRLSFSIFYLYFYFCSIITQTSTAYEPEADNDNSRLTALQTFSQRGQGGFLLTGSIQKKDYRLPLEDVRKLSHKSFRHRAKNSSIYPAFHL